MGGGFCGTTAIGAAFCWGANDYGQLGNGTLANSPAPTLDQPVEGLSEGVRLMATGINHACALSEMSGLSCWGSNKFGQLGTGNKTDSSMPTQVVLPENISPGDITALSAGLSHSCALVKDNAVYCWGSNKHGQLTGTSDESLVPVMVRSTDQKIKSISCGYSHVCITLNSGAISCWGWNMFNQIGSQPSNAIQFHEIGQVQTLVGGQYFSAAKLMDNTIRIWGTVRGMVANSDPVINAPQELSLAYPKVN
jgi:alpha-tubulin suppressor-like RCC1 family protein